MSCWALVPIKARPDCKTRLASVLSPEQRLSLVRTVLSHVLTTLRHVPCIDHIAVVSSERDQVPDSIEVLPEQGQDLNSSLTMAMASARARGATTILILHADLPTVTATDIEALLEGADNAALAIAPDDRGEGSNGLCLRADFDFPLQFGAHSFHAHLTSAQVQGLSPAVVRTSGLAFDLDTSADLELYDRLSAHSRHWHNVDSHTT